MGFFKLDLGYYDPLDELMERGLRVNMNGADVEMEDEGEFVDLTTPSVVVPKPEVSNP